MEKLPKAVRRLILTVTSSIAFWPTLIGLTFFLLSVYVWHFESTNWSKSLEAHLPFFKNAKESTQNARLLLNIIGAGTITLTIFSFSMVMIVLSQASSNLSPRIIPGLVSDKYHQIVLGVYVGTIIYTLSLIISFKPGEAIQAIPVIGILLDLFFFILCLALFVFFIHSISRAIQVENILTNIYKGALKDFQIEVVATPDEGVQLPDTQAWYVFNSLESGYLRRIEKEKLLRFAQDNNVMVEVMHPLGAFLVVGQPFLKFNRDVSQLAGLEEKMMDCFIFFFEEMVVPDFELNLRKISEIAVKALSPGINDPGTAIKALDLMTLIFYKIFTTTEIHYLKNKEKKIQVILTRTTPRELLYRYLTPIRTYGKKDVMVVLKILDSLRTLIFLDIKTRISLPELFEQVNTIRADTNEAIVNPEDRAKVNITLEQISEILPPGYSLSRL